MKDSPQQPSIGLEVETTGLTKPVQSFINDFDTASTSNAALDFGANEIVTKSSRTDGKFDLSGRLRLQTPEYSFMHTMSEELLHKYLSRSIIMQGMSNPYGLNSGPSDIEHSENMKMLMDVRPKFIHDMVWFWGGISGSHIDQACERLRKHIIEIHSFDTDVICSASIYETVNEGCNQVKIPDWVLAEFNQTVHKVSLRGADPLYFDYKEMRYAYPVSREVATGTPDITKVETQMWFYYLSTRYIDCGCEALYLGDNTLMNRVDKENGHGHYWNLLSKIRQYASDKNRGLVLIGGHWESDKYGNPQIAYFDPPHSVGAGGHGKNELWERKLLFEFMGYLPPQVRPATPSCTPSGYPSGRYEPGYQPLIIQVQEKGGKVLLNGIPKNIINESPGGLNPLGWICKYSPYILLFDGGVKDDSVTVGCEAFYNTEGEEEKTGKWMYGWDQSSWFASQSEDIRNRIIKYMYYCIRCVDSNGHYMMTGRRGTTRYQGKKNYAGGNFMYRAESGYGNQQATIKCIWNGAYAIPPEWVHHNFNKEKIFNPGPNNAEKCITLVGGDKIYYIGKDGYIHGCVFYNGTWLGVSPSYSADIYFGHAISRQSKAKSDLVASPDGKRLLYLGEDGQFHGFDIEDIWHYNYIGTFMGAKIGRWRSVVENTVIYPGNDRIYYVERMADGTQRMHGFQKSSGFWQTVSPSYSAATYASDATPIAAQFQVAGALVYDRTTSPNRIYFRGTNGYLAYYEVINIIDYRYVACPGNALLSAQGLKIVGNLAIVGNKIYYVAIYGGNPSSNDSYRIHCLVDMGGGMWNTVSPSYSAINSHPGYSGISLTAQMRSHGNGSIAVSPNGKTIAYFGMGVLSYVFYYLFEGGTDYSYHGPDEWGPSIAGYHSLQFKGNDQIFYGGTNPNNFIHQLIFEENYCKNPSREGLPGMNHYPV